MAETEGKIRVLVVDDSRIARWALRSALNSEPGIEVVGEAADPLEASDKIEKLQPNVLTLDLLMPKMDGLTFLRGLMRHRPLPVVVCSAYSPRGGKVAMEAFALGAVEIMPKPSHADDWRVLSQELVQKVKFASRARLGIFNSTPAPARAEASAITYHSNQPFIAIGASTGGTMAVERVLRQLPANIPPVLIVQHMPKGFTQAYADRLDHVCAFQVMEAQHGTTLRNGLAVIAQGGMHLGLKQEGTLYKTEVYEAPKVNHQRPSADVLFHSVASVLHSRAIGIIMTGMGLDGSKGLLRLRNAGAHTLVQSPESAIASGMPQAAIQAGAAEKIVDVDDIAPTLLSWL